MKKLIPNTITLSNLFLGCMALVALFTEELYLVIWLVAAGGVADYADGAAARILDVRSDLGKELDSMADMVSFGLVPGAIFYFLLYRLDHAIEPLGLAWAAAPGFLISVFSGLRLAKFNLDTRQTYDFLGLPTPACTILTVGLLLVYIYDPFGISLGIMNYTFLYTTILLLCILLIAEIPMFSLKIQSLSWKGNEIKIIFAAISIGLIIFKWYLAPFVIILIYILTNSILFLLNRNTRI
ncbi:MAG: CDP-alcohol phosphatidyltransferase family protein [Saprospiraceae bacterium]|nr:CDP-alcohol phosphatidyltransferase family protein [Saprospiraceae bacterium]